MNKSLLTILSLLLIFPFVGNSQKGQEHYTAPDMPMDTNTGLITYSEVVKEEGSGSEKLFDKALGWANGYYKNPTNVIREKDKASGKIVCKARYRMSNPPDKNGTITSAGDAMYKLTIELKDGRYRYTISELNWMKTSAYPVEKWMDESSPTYKSVYAYYLQQSDVEMKKVAASLKARMSKSDEAPKDDW